MNHLGKRPDYHDLDARCKHQWQRLMRGLEGTRDSEVRSIDALLSECLQLGTDDVPQFTNQQLRWLKRVVLEKFGWKRSALCFSLTGAGR